MCVGPNLLAHPPSVPMAPLPSDYQCPGCACVFYKPSLIKSREFNPNRAWKISDSPAGLAELHSQIVAFPKGSAAETRKNATDLIHAVFL